MFEEGNVGTMDVRGNVGTMDVRGNVGTMDVRGNVETMDVRGRIDTMYERMGSDGTVTLRDMEPYQRPREKCLAWGPQKLEVEELLAILLRTGYRGQSALMVAKELLQTLDQGAYGLNTATVDTLTEIKGIGPDKAVTISAAIELGRRLGELKVKNKFKDFSNPRAVATYVMERLRHHTEEHFCVALLTVKNTLIRLETISVGGISSSMAEQRAIFRAAVLSNAASMILIHNHPSGDDTPSDADVKVTKILRKAGEVMGIPVLDHIVIGDGVYTSLREKGYW